MSLQQNLTNNAFANSSNNYEEIYKAAKREKNEIEHQLNKEKNKYELEISPIEMDKKNEIDKAYPQNIAKIEENIKFARKKSTSSAHFWLSFFYIGVIIFGLVTLFKEHIIERIQFFATQPYLMYVLAGILIIILALIDSGITKKRWAAKARNLQSCKEIKEWELLRKQINDKYDAQIKEVYNHKYSYKIESLEKELAVKTQLYDIAKNDFIQSKHANTIFIYFKSMKHSWTQTWCACTVKIDGNEVLYTTKDQLSTVKINDGYHSIQIKISAKISDSVDSYTYSYQFSPKECPAFIIFDKFDLYGNPRQITIDEFQKISNINLID